MGAVHQNSTANDGAGEFRTLFQIYIPLSKPVLATVGLPKLEEQGTLVIERPQTEEARDDCRRC